ncbi:NAD(P)-binding domain-containing protein [Krasilnikoviella flava]|uniref:NAD(P)-binding domain-containing protein n=1 Tax=Krasilnikoviella flava TaxID=526729 RepID=UPI001FE5BAFB|nr:NAD(P)-binding domain-containing protein [Krasilnikoviella flava]
MSRAREAVALLGLGVMGRALAATLLDGGRAVTVWNRSPGRDTELVERGAHRAAAARDAVLAAPVVVVCLYDHVSRCATRSSRSSSSCAAASWST